MQLMRIKIIYSCYLYFCSFHYSFPFLMFHISFFYHFLCEGKNFFWKKRSSCGQSFRVDWLAINSFSFSSYENMFISLSLPKDRQFHQIQNSWMTVVFFQNLKNIVTLSMASVVSEQKPWVFLWIDFFLQIMCHFFLSAFNIFLAFSFQSFNYNVSWHGFFFLSLSCLEFTQFPGCVSFTKFCKFQPIISSHILSAPHPFTCLSGTPMI